MKVVSDLVRNAKSNEIILDIISDIDCMIKVYETTSKKQTIRDNLIFRIDSLSTNVVDQVTAIIAVLDSIESNEVRMIELFGSARHILLYADPQLNVMYGFYEIYNSDFSKLIALESEYIERGLQLDGIWKSFNAGETTELQ